jgi:hypothetical protein
VKRDRCRRTRTRTCAASLDLTRVRHLHIFNIMLQLFLSLCYKYVTYAYLPLILPNHGCRPISLLVKNPDDRISKVNIVYAIFESISWPNPFTVVVNQSWLKWFSGSGSRKTKIRKKWRNFMFWTAGCSLWRVRCFVCRLEKFDLKKIWFSVIKNLHLDPELPKKKSGADPQYINVNPKHCFKG